MSSILSKILTKTTELCALCLKETASHWDLNMEKYRTQITSILPEFDITIIKSPVICKGCSDSLKNAYRFKCNCLEVQKSITSRIKDVKEPIRLADLFIFVKEETSCNDDNCSQVDIKEPVVSSNINEFKFETKEELVKDSKQNTILTIEVDDSDDEIIKTVTRKPKKPLNEVKRANMKHFKVHKKTITLSEKTSYLCSICGITTTTKSALSYHHRTHTGERPHKCPYCQKTFSQGGACTMHIKCIHSKERPYVCDICGKNFAWKRSYDGHMLVVHNKEEKKHKCDVCGAAFHFSHKLKEHMRYHTGARDYICKICDRAFAQSVYLKRHMSVHTGEKRYACHLCSKRFSLSYNRTLHVRSCSRKFKPEHKIDGSA